MEQNKESMAKEQAALETRLAAMEQTLAYQTELLEQHAEREKKRRIWFFIKLAIVVVLLVVLVPRMVQLYQDVNTFIVETQTQMAAMEQQVSAFLTETSEDLDTISKTMENIQTLIQPVVQFIERWKGPW